ncbi:MAG: plastocyanin/azurin family copper-binding protein [Thermoplasmatota archaeon]
MRPLTLGLVALVLLLAGCAAKTNPTPASPASSANTSMSGMKMGGPVSLALGTMGQYPVNPAFDKATLTVEHGANVTLKFSNNDPSDPAGAGLNPIQHGVKFDGFTAATKVISAGASDTITFTAPAPGTYKYYCPVGDHRARGMEGTLTVT